MPTAYTAILDEAAKASPTAEVPFRTFALRCAHAMACAQHERDLADLPGPQPYDAGHYEEEVRKHRQKLRELQGMTAENALPFWTEEVDRCAKWNREAAEHNTRLGAAYTDMRAKVEAWKPPPTKEHERLQRFMLEQLAQGFHPTDFVAKPHASPAAWLADEIQRNEEWILYCEKKIAVARQNAVEAEAFFKTFFESLPA